MLSQIIEEYGDQITAAIEVFLFVILVAGFFIDGLIGNIIVSISEGMC